MLVVCSQLVTYAYCVYKEYCSNLTVCTLATSQSRHTVLLVVANVDHPSRDEQQCCSTNYDSIRAIKGFILEEVAL